MGRKCGIEGEIRADEAAARLWLGQIGVALCAVPGSDAGRMRVSGVLGSGEMGARPPLADSVREW